MSTSVRIQCGTWTLHFCPFMFVSVHVQMCSKRLSLDWGAAENIRPCTAAVRRLRKRG